MVDEYEQIQRLRELWTRSIMIWGQVFIPLILIIFSIFITKLPRGQHGLEIIVYDHAGNKVTQTVDVLKFLKGIYLIPFFFFIIFKFNTLFISEGIRRDNLL